MLALEVLTLGELQRLGRGGDERALTQLGRAVLDYDFCLFDSPRVYCEHLHELFELQQQLDNEPPLDCPHCGKFLGRSGDTEQPFPPGSRARGVLLQASLLIAELSKGLERGDPTWEDLQKFGRDFDAVMTGASDTEQRRRDASVAPANREIYVAMAVYDHEGASPLKAFESEEDAQEYVDQCEAHAKLNPEDDDDDDYPQVFQRWLDSHPAGKDDAHASYYASFNIPFVEAAIEAEGKENA